MQQVTRKTNLVDPTKFNAYHRRLSNTFPLKSFQFDSYAVDMLMKLTINCGIVLPNVITN